MLRWLPSPEHVFYGPGYGITPSVNTANVFHPPRRNGIIFQASAIVVLSLVTAWSIWRAANAEIGPAFILYLLPALLSFGLVPLLAYRLQSLLVAEYRLEREGIRLRWGLRYEDIPMNVLQWVKPAEELDDHLPLPWLRWPGSVLGVRKMAAGTPLEYLAADANKLILVATRERVYALSPENPDEFLDRFQRLFELGSLSPFTSRSVYPSFLFARVWRVRAARTLITAGGIANLILLVWVSLAVSSREQVLLGFVPGGVPVPSIRLMLLPLLSGFFYLFDLLTGLYFFRSVGRPDRKDEGQDASEDDEKEQKLPEPVFAYLLWASGAICALMFNLAIFFILQNPGSA